MKAVVLDSDPSEVDLQWNEWPDPDTAPGWITVKVRAAGLNRNDSMNVAGRESRSARSVIGAAWPRASRSQSRRHAAICRPTGADRRGPGASRRRRPKPPSCHARKRRTAPSSMPPSSLFAQKMQLVSVAKLAMNGFPITPRILFLISSMGIPPSEFYGGRKRPFPLLRRAFSISAITLLVQPFSKYVLAGRHLKGDTVHCPHHPLLRGEVRAEIVDLEKRFRHNPYFRSIV